MSVETSARRGDRALAALQVVVGLPAGAGVVLWTIAVMCSGLLRRASAAH